MTNGHCHLPETPRVLTGVFIGHERRVQMGGKRQHGAALLIAEHGEREDVRPQAGARSLE